jgi:hypothetical protein
MATTSTIKMNGRKSTLIQGRGRYYMDAAWLYYTSPFLSS